MKATPPPQISVLLVDDHAMLRQGIRAMLETDPQFAVVGEAANGREAVKLAGRLQPDVILMDIGMPELNGIDATKQILAANPAAKVLALSAHSEDTYLERVSAAGAAGFVEKRTSVDILTEAVRAVAEGRTYFRPAIAKRLHHYQFKTRRAEDLRDANGNELTTRESEVLQLVAEGFGNKQAAWELGISVKTVEKHRQHLMDKLNIHNTAQLTHYAINAGIVECSAREGLG